MAEHTRTRPTWVLAGLELLNERLNAALRRRASYEAPGAAVQIRIDEVDNDIADYRRQIAEWRARYGLAEEEVTSG